MRQQIFMAKDHAFDLAVVGAGPAGSAAAIWGAERGLSVLLVDRFQSPRVRPGECLHPGIEALFRDLGVLDQVLAKCQVRPLGRSVSVGEKRRFEYFGSDAEGPWRAFHLSRAELDDILRNRAQQLGVTLRIHRSRIAPVIGDGRIEGIDLGGQTLRCAFVIDATGQSAWLTRALGRRQIAVSPRMTAFFGYRRGRMFDEQMFLADAAGWQWVAQVSQNVVNWTSMHFGVHKAPYPPDVISSLSPCGISGGVDVTWRMAPLVAGPSHFIVGDAALVTDPASGNGVLRAVMSGIKAASNARAVIAGHALEAAAARDYEVWLRRWFVADVDRLKSMYESLRADWQTPCVDIRVARQSLPLLPSRSPLTSLAY
jgi:flavin-dependent dehydrogenase